MSPTAITLRLATLADAQALATMSRDVIEAGLGWRYSPARIATLCRDAETVALVACEADSIKGFAVMKFGDERAHLLLLAVQPAQQRGGIGRRLLEWLVESAQVAGMASIHLELRADNAGARAFYRRLGFGETIVVPSYYARHVPALRMVKLLRRPASGG